MIHSITGTISGVTDEGMLIDHAGIEYEIACSQLTREHLRRQPAPQRVLTWLYVREDQMKLFGFSDVHERDTFHALLAVPGIGPKQALKVLSGMPWERLRQVIESQDVNLLATLPGLGKKTAQKIILQLSDTLPARSSDPEEPHDDLLQGLVDMGFDRRQAAAVLKELRVAAHTEEGPAALDDSEIFRQAIVRLS